MAGHCAALAMTMPPTCRAAGEGSMGPADCCGQLCSDAQETGMLQRHWEDLALDKEAVPLAPDWARYEQMEATGMLSAIAVQLVVNGVTAIVRAG